MSGMRYWIDIAKYTGIAVFAGSIIAPKFVVTDCICGGWLILVGYIMAEIMEVLDD